MADTALALLQDSMIAVTRMLGMQTEGNPSIDPDYTLDVVEAGLHTLQQVTELFDDNLPDAVVDPFNNLLNSLALLNDMVFGQS